MNRNSIPPFQFTVRLRDLGTPQRQNPRSVRISFNVVRNTVAPRFINCPGSSVTGAFLREDALIGSNFLNLTVTDSDQDVGLDLFMAVFKQKMNGIIYRLESLILTS